MESCGNCRRLHGLSTGKEEWEQSEEEEKAEREEVWSRMRKGGGRMKRNMRMMVMGRGEGKQVVACGLSVTPWRLRCLTELPKELAP